MPRKDTKNSGTRTFLRRFGNAYYCVCELIPTLTSLGGYLDGARRTFLQRPETGGDADGQAVAGAADPRRLAAAARGGAPVGFGGWRDAPRGAGRPSHGLHRPIGAERVRATPLAGTVRVLKTGGGGLSAHLIGRHPSQIG